jgi:4-hydroxy-tetrahydrodipicolinate synthase
MTPITGSIVALVTPMHDDGSVDYPALRKLIDWHIAEGTDCIGVVGTTGESPTVDVEEHQEIIRVSVEQAARPRAHHGRLRRQFDRRGDRAGALRQEGRRRLPAAGGALLQQAHAGRPVPALQGHRRSGGDLPMVLYNVPGRTVADMLHDTVLRLAQVPGIVGIKEATGNIERAQWLLREVPKGFAVYSGDDPTAVALMLCGGQGNVSVTANVAPRLMHELCVAAIRGRCARRWNSSAGCCRCTAPVRGSQPDPGEVGDGAHGPVRPDAAPADDRRCPPTKPWSKARCAPRPAGLNE